MKGKGHVLLQVVVFFLCVLLIFFISGEGWAEEQPNKWDAAGKEIGEAAGAVGDASREGWQKTKKVTSETIHGAKEKGVEGWDKTKEKGSELAGKTTEVSGQVVESAAQKSKGFWQKTVDTSKRWYNKTKAKIHEMTAPDSQE